MMLAAIAMTVLSVCITEAARRLAIRTLSSRVKLKPELMVSISFGVRNGIGSLIFWWMGVATWQQSGPVAATIALAGLSYLIGGTLSHGAHALLRSLRPKVCERTQGTLGSLGQHRGFGLLVARRNVSSARTLAACHKFGGHACLDSSRLRKVLPSYLRFARAQINL